MRLYRPVGIRVLEPIAETAFRAFPPRLTHQPIFYPVLSFEYAEKIARDWNTKDPASGYRGFVTRFEIPDSYAEQFEVHTVGSSTHQELWVTAERLEAFNSHLLAPISIASSYYGEFFSGDVDQESDLPAHVANRNRATRGIRDGALRLLLRGNGNMLERILCPYQLVQGPEVEALQSLAKGAACRRFHGHYAGFFRAMCNEYEKNGTPPPKQVLYAYRVAVTGIHLLRTGELEADLSVLAERYDVPEALPLIEVKRRTAEKVLLDRSEIPLHRRWFERLGQGLENALAVSPLEEEPPNSDACERWLIDL